MVKGAAAEAEAGCRRGKGGRILEERPIKTFLRLWTFSLFRVLNPLSPLPTTWSVDPVLEQHSDARTQPAEPPCLETPARLDSTSTRGQSFDHGCFPNSPRQRPDQTRFYQPRRRVHSRVGRSRPAAEARQARRGGAFGPGSGSRRNARTRALRARDMHLYEHTEELRERGELTDGSLPLTQSSSRFPPTLDTLALPHCCTRWQTHRRNIGYRY